jgi:ATP-binding cassette subfamily B (MDR/TAP) protein 1
MKSYLKQARCQSLQIGTVIFWVIMLFVIGFWYGIVLIEQGLQPGAVLTTFYATLAAFQGIEALMPQWLVLVKGMSAGRELREMTTDEDDAMSARIEAIAVGGRPNKCFGNLEMRNVRSLSDK